MPSNSQRQRRPTHFGWVNRSASPKERERETENGENNGVVASITVLSVGCMPMRAVQRTCSNRVHKIELLIRWLWYEEANKNWKPHILACHWRCYRSIQVNGKSGEYRSLPNTQPSILNQINRFQNWIVIIDPIFITIPFFVSVPQWLPAIFPMTTKNQMQANCFQVKMELNCS